MDQNIRIILKYLKEKDCIESFLALERESGISLVDYSKQIQFFKKILLKGDFNEAVTFLLTFENRIEENQFKKIVLDIYKQKLYELIENPNEEELKNLFQTELINYSTEEEFQELFGLLTYRSVNQIEELSKWTILRGRYQCFESAIPYLEMFNSVLKNQSTEDNFQDIMNFYHQNKNILKEPYSFNRNSNQNELFQKNKSSIPTHTYKASHQYTSSQDSDKKKPPMVSNQSNVKQQEIIKNSIANMNISGNYSQMKSKLMASRANPPPSPKINPVSIQQSESKVLIDNKSRQSAFQEVGQKNPSIRDSGSKSSFVEEKRPRVNASLNGPMNREKIQNSVKVDNYLKNDSNMSEQNTPSSYKNIKLQKSQMVNSGNYSNLAKAAKQEKVSYPSKVETPMTFSHFNEMQSSELNEIEEEDHSEATKSIKNEKSKYSYLMSKHQDDELEDEVRKNIEYLQQTSSVIYNKGELEQEGYTFANQQEEEKEFKVTKIIKLAATTDSKAIRTCQFSESGNLFAVGTNSSVLKIFDVQRLFSRNKFQDIQPIYQIDGLHLKSIFCLQWHSNQRSILTCSNDLNVKMTEISKNFTDHKTSIIGKHDSCIRMVKYHPSEVSAVSCGDDSVLKVWDLTKIKKSSTLKGHTNSVSAFKLQNQNQLYSVSKDQTMKKWDLRMSQNVTTSQHQESELTYIANNINDIVVSHKNGTVSFFSQDLQLIHSVQIHEEEIRSIEGLKKEKTLLTASFDGHVALFNENSSHQPSYFQHNDCGQDKVVYATFLHSPLYKGFSSTSTQGLCHVYSYE